MKALIFVLVVGNLLFYAFAAGLFGRPDNPDALRVEQQVAAQRLHIVSRGEPPTAPAAPANAPPPKAAPVAASADASICLAWPRLAAADADRLAAIVGENFAAFKVDRRSVASEGSGWWVHIPPLADRAAVDKKTAELRGLGVKDFFVIPEGPVRFAISLGVFSTENAAQEHLAHLQAKGVRSAKFGLRPGKEAWFRVEASGPAALRADLLTAVAGVLPAIAAQACE